MHWIDKNQRVNQLNVNLFRVFNCSGGGARFSNVPFRSPRLNQTELHVVPNTFRTANRLLRRVATQSVAASFISPK